MREQTQERKRFRSRGRGLFTAFLERNGISFAAAARALGVSAVAVHDWAKGFKRPTEEHRQAIAVWTNDEVPALSWRLASDPDVVSAVKPFRPTGTDC